MGRPRKRQKLDDEPAETQDTSLENTRTYYQSDEEHPPSLSSSAPGSILHNQYAPAVVETQIATPIDPSLSEVDHDRTNFTNICNGPIAQSIRNAKSSATPEENIAQFRGASSGNEIQSDKPLAQYPLDIAQWPDFSGLETLPVPMYDSAEAATTCLAYGQTTSTDDSSPYRNSHADSAPLNSLPSVPACPCLPNLYLTLSTLSSLSSFPVSQHTVDTLLAAHRTAHSVIYCHVCPLKYQSGSQNLMLGCTLLNVIADHWHRIPKAEARDLRKGFCDPECLRLTDDNAGRTFISTKEGQMWRQFAHDLVRAYVFGDLPVPKPPDPSAGATDALSHPALPSVSSNNDTSQNGGKVEEKVTLAFLIDALRRRQRQWHDLDELTDEFPDRPRCTERHHSVHSVHSHDHQGSTSRQSQEQGTAGSRPTQGQANGSTSNSIADGRGKEASAEERDGDHHHGCRKGSDGGVNGKKHDHLLCLMIVQSSVDMVKALDDKKEV